MVSYGHPAIHRKQAASYLRREVDGMLTSYLSKRKRSSSPESSPQSSPVSQSSSTSAHADERTIRKMAEAQVGGVSSEESRLAYERGDNPGGLHHHHRDRVH